MIAYIDTYGNLVVVPESDAEIYIINKGDFYVEIESETQKASRLEKEPADMLSAFAIPRDVPFKVGGSDIEKQGS